MTDKLKGLPVSGYVDQTQSAVDLVNTNKQIEEVILRRMDELAKLPAGTVDGRHFALARTNIEQGFMWLNRSIFQPSRVSLPDDSSV